MQVATQRGTPPAATRSTQRSHFGATWRWNSSGMTPNGQATAQVWQPMQSSSERRTKPCSSR